MIIGKLVRYRFSNVIPLPASEERGPLVLINRSVKHDVAESTKSETLYLEGWFAMKISAIGGFSPYSIAWINTIKTLIFPLFVEI